MSYENLSDSGSQTLQLPLGTTKSSTKCKGCTRCLKTFLWVVGVIMFIFAIIAVGLVLRKVHLEKRVLDCYECISTVGWTFDEPGLPYEKKCSSVPRNHRLCQEGEVCAYVKMKEGKRQRFQRNCRRSEHIGCRTGMDGNATVKYCYCDTRLCVG